MDPCFSGEDLVIKARKPYTITKQREKWSEEEHNRFLEALKLYGRAWQRIEEHIGTKTAVQIRSHAQKFFTKLEKEGGVKGAGCALDIDIPPPRPKKKPTYPYPKKTGGAPVLQLRLKDDKPSDATSTSLNMVFVKETEDLSDDAKHQNSDHEHDDVNLDMVAPCASPTSTNSSIASEVSERSCTFRQFLPLLNGSRTQTGSADEKQLLNDSTVTMNLSVSPEESSQGEIVDDPSDEGSHHNCPRHVPVHILETTQQQWIPKQAGVFHGDRTIDTNAATSATSENEPAPSMPLPIASGHPFFAPTVNPEEYQSIMQMSSTFSSLILSVLAQNAASYAAAASFASTLWPWLNSEAPSTNSSEIPKPMNPNPSMVAMAGATMAAATAWWTANGLLPFCPQYHPGFAVFSPSPGTEAPMAGCQSGIINGEATPQCRQPDAELFNAPNLASKPPSSSSSDSEEASEAERLNGGSNPNVVEPEESDGSNKSKTMKQLDPSSLAKKHNNTTSKTGFRLYKRCLMEAQESRVPDERKDPKKLRL